MQVKEWQVRVIRYKSKASHSIASQRCWIPSSTEQDDLQRHTLRSEADECFITLDLHVGIYQYSARLADMFPSDGNSFEANACFTV